MKFLRVLRTLVVGSAALLLAQSFASADSFGFVFSSAGANVGTGTFSFSGVVGDGTYYLGSLASYNIDFTIGSSTFTNADIATPTTASSGVQVVIYSEGSDMYFSNDGTYGGPYSGSLDFTSGGADLSFEPPFFGPPPLDLFSAFDSNGNSYFGTFSATSTTPEPASAALVSLIFGAGAIAPWLKKKSHLR